jgi:anti-sigma B factor antagonist
MPTSSLTQGESCGKSALTVHFTTPVARVLLATVEGDLDLTTASTLDDRVRAELRGRRLRWLVMELSGLRFLGPQGTAVVERLRRAAAADGIDMILVGLSPACERALQFTGVLDRFIRYADLRAALTVAARGGRVGRGSRALHLAP